MYVSTIEVFGKRVYVLLPPSLDLNPLHPDMHVLQIILH